MTLRAREHRAVAELARRAAREGRVQLVSEWAKADLGWIPSPKAMKESAAGLVSVMADIHAADAVSTLQEAAGTLSPTEGLPAVRTSDLRRERQAT